MAVAPRGGGHLRVPVEPIGAHNLRDAHNLRGIRCLRTEVVRVAEIAQE